MAGKDLEFGLRVKADLDQARKEVATFINAIDGVSESVDDANSSTKKYTKETKDLGAETKKTTKEQEDQKRVVESLLRTYDKTHTELRELDRAAEDLNKAYKSGKVSLDQYNRSMANIGKRRAELTQIERSFAGIENRVKGFIAALASGAIFRSFVSNTIEAERAQLKLAAVLRTTGESAGFSFDQLVLMSNELSATTGIQARDIQGAQTRLLTYTQIIGENYPRALRAAIDMAAIMGISVESAAEQVGKAIDKPSQGLSQLTEQGFRFTQQQKDQVAALEESGRVADAQTIILAELESVYKGTAEAARNGLGGAVQELGNALGDLLALDGNSENITETKESIEELIEVLRSDAAKGAVAAFAGELASLSADVIGFAAEIGKTVDAVEKSIGGEDYETPTWLSRVGEELNKFVNPVKRLGDAADSLKKFREGLYGSSANEPVATSAIVPSSPVVSEPELPVANAEYDKYLDNLKKQLLLQTDNTEAAKLRFAIESGALKNLTPQMRTALELEAARVDLAEKNKKAAEEQKRIDEQKAKQQKDYVESLERQAAVIGLTGKALSDQQNAEKGLTGAMLERANAARKLLDLEKERKSVAEDAKQLASLQVQLLRAQGKEEEALTLEMEERYKALLKRLETRSDESGIAIVKSLINIEALSLQLNEAEKEINEVLARQQQQETSIAAQREAGLITEAEARRRIVDLHKETYEQLEKQRPLLEELAKQPGQVGEAAATTLAALNAQSEQLTATMDLFQATLRNAVESGLTDAIYGLAKGTLSFKEAISELGRSVLDAILKIQAQELAQSITGAALGSGGSGGGGGYASTAANFIGGLFGYADGGHVTGPGTSVSDSIPAMLSNNEFVTRAAIVNQNGALDFLHDFNRRGMHAIADWAPVRHNTGGLAGVPAPAMPSPTLGNSQLPEPAAAFSSTVENKQNFYMVDDPQRIGEILNSDVGEDAMIVRISRNPQKFQQALKVGR